MKRINEDMRAAFTELNPENREKLLAHARRVHAIQMGAPPSCGGRPAGMGGESGKASRPHKRFADLGEKEFFSARAP